MKTRLFGCSLLALVAAVSLPLRAAEPDLAQGFQNPPDSAKPHTWWHWMNGNITREGITADLEAMKKAGLGGAQIFNAACDIPHGPVQVLSPEWRQLMHHAFAEADRLGLEMCVHDCGGWSSSGGPWVKPQYAMQVVTTSELHTQGPTRFAAMLPQPMKRRDFYRDIAVLAFRTPAAEAGAKPGSKPKTERAKTGYERADRLEPDTARATPPGTAIPRAEVVELTSKMDATGKLSWTVPAGQWTIVRFGYTCTGKDNHPAPPEATGLEVDKLSRKAMDAFWPGMMGKLIQDAGPLAGRSFNNALIDSYEVGSQNWTPLMRKEFERRRGYDLLPFLPALTGRVVGSAEVTERFLWDFRRTIADLFADNYYGYFAELCHQHGLKFSTEPYGNGNFDNLQCGGRADIVMGEFWVNGSASETLKLAASVAHTRGRTLVGAESFTATEHEDGWRVDPWAIKVIGDLTFCDGVNRYIFHRYAHQPWLDKWPGMTMGPWGTHFDRTETWWEPGAAWLRYVARCQFLLQSGRFVADLCYFYGETAPADLPARARLKPAVPAGYDYDGCDLEVLKQMSVKAGRVVLPGGMNYRVLVLPESRYLAPATLRKVSELVKAGATVVGPKPDKSPSLTDFPPCDREVAKLAEEVWGNCDGKTVVEHGFGKGKVVCGKPLEEVLGSLGGGPDFEGAGRLLYIHRRAGNTDLYFVSNQRRAAAQADCVFRVSGRQPELWHPDTGLIEPAPVWSERNGRTTVPLRFDPAGSVFVVFRKLSGTAEHIARTEKAGAETNRPAMPSIEIHQAVYEATDGAGGKDVTQKLAALVRSGELAILADNANFGDPTVDHVKRLRVDYSLNGKRQQKTAAENQTLELALLPNQSAWPEAVLSVGADGRTALHAFQPGEFEFKTAAGERLRAEVAAVPAPVEITGPWTVRFTPGWGAPASVKFDKLESWTERPESGVRYFSGTAEYVKEFDVPASLLAASRQLWLDLGTAKNFAAVTLNGVKFEALWKPPFRLDVTRALKPGRNALAIKVTNLWPNRLIGDEQLPDDREWEGSHLKRWPDWLLEGEPRPNTGRFTFTTWRYYNKSSPLLESGLLGPVVLRAAEFRALTR